MARKPILILALGASLLAHARDPKKPIKRQGLPVRTATFEADLRWKRAAVLDDQAKLFANENADEQKRPIWILGGDSLSAAWANGGSLFDRLQSNEVDVGLDELIKAEKYGDAKDNLEHGPQAYTTWYAGSANDGGVFERLNILTRQDWLIVATALTGVNFLPQRSVERDPIRMIEEVSHPERVRLVSFSLGSNDICGGVNPAADPDFLREKLKKMKARFSPETTFVAWDLPDYAAYRSYILNAVKTAPPSKQQAKLAKYCELQWDQYRCNFARNKKALQFRNETRKILTEVFGELFTMDTRSLEPLKALAADCFHPSRELQKVIADQFFAFIHEHGKLSP